MSYTPSSPTYLLIEPTLEAINLLRILKLVVLAFVNLYQLIEKGKHAISPK